MCLPAPTAVPGPKAEPFKQTQEVKSAYVRNRGLNLLETLTTRKLLHMKMLFKLLFIAQFSKVKGNDDFIPLSELACLHKLTSKDSEQA